MVILTCGGDGVDLLRGLLRLVRLVIWMCWKKGIPLRFFKYGIGFHASELIAWYERLFYLWLASYIVGFPRS